MTSRTMKLFMASTAFVAAASSGHAVSDTISVSQTVAAETSNTNAGILTIADDISVIVAGGAALEISDTAVPSNNVSVNVGSNATVSSDDAGGTVVTMGDSAVTGVTINNSGTIVNTGTGAAINSTVQNASSADIDFTINNVGTISGSIDVGAGDINYTATGGTQNGDITTTSTGTNGVTLTDSSMTGNVDLGDSTASLVVSNSTLVGNYAGGGGDDTVEIKDSSTVTGNINTGAGTADSVTVSNSRVNGNIAFGTGATGTLTLTNATVSGTISDAGGAGDVLNINGENAFTTYSTISGFEDVNIGTDMTVGHDLTGADTIDIATGKTVAANADMTASGILTNAGTLNIAADKTVTADTYVGTGGTLGIAIASSNTTSGQGKIVLGGGDLATGTSVTINMAATSGFIASGTQYVIGTGTGTQGVASLTTDSNGVYRYSTAAVGNDLVLTVGRVSTSSVVTGGDNQNAANVLDVLGANATGELGTLQGTIGSQATATGVQNVLESLVPSIDGAGTASVNMAVDMGNQVSNRLASVRSNGYGVATGDAMAANHMWVQGFGSTVEQDDKNGARGYDANAAGMSIGMDTDSLVDGYTTGVALTYGKGNVDSNAFGGASTDIDTYAATVYGSRVMDNGVFVNGQLGFAFNQYDMSRNVTSIGRSTGDTDGWQTSAKVEAGRDYAMGGLTLTPMASLQYTYLDMDSYTETGAGGASLRVNPESMSTVDAGLGGEMSYAMPLNDGGMLKPSVHAKYIYRMGDDSMGTTSQFVGGGAAFSTSGVKADRSSVNLGAGLLLTTVGGTDLSINYDADIRSSLTGHTGQLKARWAF